PRRRISHGIAASIATAGMRCGDGGTRARSRWASSIAAGHLRRAIPGPDDVFQSYGLPWANASNTPFRLYKPWVHEGGIATPLIASWPAVIKKPGITHQPGHVIDVMATCLDVAGVAYPKTFQGRPILSLEGKS